MDVATLRKAKDDYFKHSPHSPLTPAQQPGFKGLVYFAEDPQFRFALPLEATEHGHEEVQMSDGSVQRMRRAGRFRFSVDGVEVALTAFDSNGGGLFVPFRDATSGRESYGAGRYVEPEAAGDGRYELDFNRAYNPYCAYNENWRCPLPPTENWLSVAIRAGEKEFPH